MPPVLTRRASSNAKSSGTRLRRTFRPLPVAPTRAQPGYDAGALLIANLHTPRTSHP